MSGARVIRMVVGVVVVLVTPGLLQMIDFPALRDRPLLAAQERPEMVVHGRGNKDDDKKGEANADKRAEQEGNPRNRDKPPRRSNADNQREVETNNLGDDAFQVEGLVLATLCKRNPKEVVIGTIDGDVTLRLHPRRFRDGFEWEGDVRCDDLLPGDYIYVHEAQKANEALYDVYEFRCRRDNSSADSGDDNDNGSSEGEEDSCPHNPPPPGLAGRTGPPAPDLLMRLSAALGLQGQSSLMRPRQPLALAERPHGTRPETARGVAADNADEEEPLPPGWKAVFVPAGQAAVLTSDDGRVSITVQQGHIPVPLALTYGDLDALAYPPTPGPNVGALFTLIAWSADGPLDRLPAPINVGVHYTPRYAAGLDVTRLTLGLLDTDAGGWVDVPSIPDPDARYVSATVAWAGVYAAYERPLR